MPRPSQPMGPRPAAVPPSSAIPPSVAYTMGFQPGEPVGLRDRFAMAAMTGLIVNPDWNERTWADMAGLAYEVADAMLAARKK